jgi:hypothetical protein
MKHYHSEVINSGSKQLYGNVPESNNEEVQYEGDGSDQLRGAQTNIGATGNPTNMTNRDTKLEIYEL